MVMTLYLDCKASRLEFINRVVSEIFFFFLLCFVSTEKNTCRLLFGENVLLSFILSLAYFGSVIFLPHH